MGLRDQSALYSIVGTPLPVPLRFNRDGYYRVAARVQCRTCGRGFVQIERCHRFRSILVRLTPVPAPDPSDIKVITSILIHANNHGVGNPKVHTRGCPVGKMPSGRHRLAGVGGRG